MSKISELLLSKLYPDRVNSMNELMGNDDKPTEAKPIPKQQLKKINSKTDLPGLNVLEPQAEADKSNFITKFLDWGADKRKKVLGATFRGAKTPYGYNPDFKTFMNLPSSFRTAMSEQFFGHKIGKYPTEKEYMESDINGDKNTRAMYGIRDELLSKGLGLPLMNPENKGAYIENDDGTLSPNPKSILGQLAIEPIKNNVYDNFMENQGQNEFKNTSDWNPSMGGVAITKPKYKNGDLTYNVKDVWDFDPSTKMQPGFKKTITKGAEDLFNWATGYKPVTIKQEEKIPIEEGDLPIWAKDKENRDWIPFSQTEQETESEINKPKRVKKRK
jgi:hypothetical protein